MALITVGRVPFATQALVEHTNRMNLAEGRIDAACIRMLNDGDVGGASELETVKADLEKAKQELEDARKNLLASLAPWIPGDYIVAYGVLLTAWTSLRNDFPALLLITAAAAVVLVVGSAFAETGFKGTTKKQARELTVRTVIGFAVSIFASVAIPTSGWYDFAFFRDNEASIILTASAVAIIPVLLILKGLNKATGIKLTV